MTKKTLLLDLDHTIIQPKNGGTHPKNTQDWEFVPGIADKLKEYSDAGYRMFIVSNQAGIQHGYMTADQFKEKCESVMSDLRNAGVDMVNCVFCESKDKDHHWRKPQTGMFEMLDDAYKIDKSTAMMVGDMDTDEMFATNVGIKFMYVQDFLKNQST